MNTSQISYSSVTRFLLLSIPRIAKKIQSTNEVVTSVLDAAHRQYIAKKKVSGAAQKWQDIPFNSAEVTIFFEEWTETFITTDYRQIFINPERSAVEEEIVSTLADFLGLHYPSQFNVEVAKWEFWQRFGLACGLQSDGVLTEEGRQLYTALNIFGQLNEDDVGIILN